MEKIRFLLANYHLQIVFGMLMFFILGALIWGFVYLSQPENTQTPKGTAPTPVAQKTLPTPTIIINTGEDFTQEELSYPTMPPEPGSDYSHAGGIAVTSNPSGATITFTAENADEQNAISYTTPFRTTGLMVGNYTVTATKPGFETRTFTTAVVEGEVTRINLTLKPL